MLVEATVTTIVGKIVGSSIILVVITVHVAGLLWALIRLGFDNAKKILAYYYWQIDTELLGM